MISFIIPNRGGDKIEYIVSKIKEFYKDSEFIVVSQDDDKPFMRGQLINIGVKESNGDYICAIDNDIFFKTKIDLVKIYKSYKCKVLQPFNKIEQVTLKSNNKFISTSTREAHYKKGGACGGITFASRENFLNCNGFSNLYIGWGCEDNDFYYRNENGFINITNTICHITHPRRTNTNKSNSLLNEKIRKSFNSRNYNKDGIAQITYNKVLDSVINNIRYISVNNIGVNPGFEYQDILDAHYNVRSELTKNYFKMLSDEFNRTINSDYILLGVPKHVNLGDTLIWEAENKILDTVPYKKLKTLFFNTSIETIKSYIKPDTKILFHGGGYFGDVWKSSIKYVDSILDAFKDNEIIFIPNSIWYDSIDRANITKEILKSRRAKTIIYCREQQSLDFCNKYFGPINNVEYVLMPDVVLSWDIDSFINSHVAVDKNIKGDSLYITRTDHELESVKNIKVDRKSDWPTMHSKPAYVNMKYTCEQWEANVKNKLILDAINFVIGYNKVYSDRMHGSVLGWLLDKEVSIIDNSYHKSSALYNTWLKDSKMIHMYGDPINIKGLTITSTNKSTHTVHKQASTSQNSKVCIVAIAKLENHYINEWINHHLNIGIDHIYLYDNNDLHGERLSSVVHNDKVTIIDVIDKKYYQKTAYTEAYHKYRQHYDWFLFIDIDEFVMLSKKYKTIKSFISFINKKAKNPKIIRLCWKNYGDSNKLDVVDGKYNVVKRFLLPSSNKQHDKTCKMLLSSKVDVDEFRSVHSVHVNKTKNIDYSKSAVNALGIKCPNTNTRISSPVHVNCWINHYRTKTIGEFIRQKYVRGNANNPWEQSEYVSASLPIFWKLNTRTAQKEAYAKKLIAQLSN